MKMTATALLSVAALFSVLTGSAQLKFPVSNNDLRNSLEKIVSDYPSQFARLKGDTLESNPQTIEFATRLDFKMAPENFIVEYRSLNPVYSWQAGILSTDDYEEAAKKYKWLCNQLKVMTLKLDGGYTFSLSGHYNAPDEGRKFFSSVFKLTPNASGMPKLKIEATMTYEFPEWKVGLMVYEKEREDHERGNITGE